LVKDCTAVLASGAASAEDKVIALNNRAAAREFAGEGNPDEIIRDYDEAIRLRPELAKLYYNRGVAWLRRNEITKALDDLDRAVRVDPQFAVAYGLRAEARLAQKSYDLAIRDCDEAIRLAPGYLHPLYNPYETRAQALEGKGDTAGAASERQRSSALWSKNPAAKPPPTVAGQRRWEPFISR
jgi:tetratricopeptide (TPR) repeat protein